MNVFLTLLMSLASATVIVFCVDILSQFFHNEA